MRKHVLLATLAAGLLIFQPSGQVRAEVNVNINVGAPGFVIGYNPDFFYVPNLGYSISYGGPYDIISYGGFYYLYYNGLWYRSSHYRHGRWVIIDNHRIPYKIRRHHWHDIRRYRDVHYRKLHPQRFKDHRDRNDRRDWDRRDRNDRRDWRDDRNRFNNRNDRKFDRQDFKGNRKKNDGRKEEENRYENRGGFGVDR